MRLILGICLSVALCVVSAGVVNHVHAAQPCGVCPTPVDDSAPRVAAEPKPAGPNWIFQPGNYSHDPRTGQRITQFAQLPAVQALPDTRSISSGYQRTRVNQFGTGGSVDTYYRVENWSNVPGGLDAQWERVNDVWQQSVVSGAYGSGSYGNGYGPYGRPYGGYGGYGGYGPGYGGYGPGFGGYGPGFGGPGYGYGPAFGGYPGAGYPGGSFPGGGYNGGYGTQAF